jgi:hypothetical protein
MMIVVMIGVDNKLAGLLPHLPARSLHSPWYSIQTLHKLLRLHADSAQTSCRTRGSTIGWSHCQNVTWSLTWVHVKSVKSAQSPSHFIQSLRPVQVQFQFTQTRTEFSLNKFEQDQSADIILFVIWDKTYFKFYNSQRLNSEASSISWKSSSN